MKCALLLLLLVLEVHSISMQSEIQKLVTNISSATGFAFSVGVVTTDGLAFGVGAGPEDAAVNENSTMLLGSGTKPYTAAAVMRLVDAGRVALDDRASEHIDKVLHQLTGKKFVELFGPPAADVTVGHLISMRSGIADFDVPTFDHEILETGTRVHSPAEELELVAGWDAPLGCTTGNCTFVCYPGNCTSYSSTNFILAGLVVLAHSGASRWDHLNQGEMLGMDMQREYSHSHFLDTGRMNETGLTVPGTSLQYGQAELFSQDASILGWTCGNLAASARDVAQFYYNLLGPSPSVVSAKGVSLMQQWNVLDVGWAKGFIQYGLGLMIQNVSPNVTSKCPPVDHIASYIGHGGDTYAYMSDNGWFPGLNASISVIVNQDADYEYPSFVTTCAVVEVVAKYQTGVPVDLQCRAANPNPLYRCVHAYGLPTCFPTHDPRGMNHSQCNATCV